MKKILIIEDNLLQAFLFEETLDKKKFKIESVFDSTKSLEKINDIKPDVLILDIVMPKKSGFEILRELNVKVPCVMVISSLPKEFAKKAYDLGAKYYFEKPINIFEIRDLIQEELAYIS